MKLTLKYPGLIGLAALTAACSGATDTPTEMAMVCPADQWIGIDDYPNETLPTETDFAEWLDANAKRKGVTVSDTGLQSNIIKPGLKNGASPVGTDTIVAHYYGYFPNGDRFDDSYSRGEPLELGNHQVISGWTEALRDMKVCEARIVYIPGNLAYGSSGRPGIPANATLLFKMQLLEVK